VNTPKRLEVGIVGDEIVSLSDDSTGQDGIVVRIPRNLGKHGLFWNLDPFRQPIQQDQELQDP